MSDFGVALLCGQLWNRSNDDTYYNRKIAGAAACNGHIHRSGPLLCFGFGLLTRIMVAAAMAAHWLYS